MSLVSLCQVSDRARWRMKTRESFQMHCLVNRVFMTGENTKSETLPMCVCVCVSEKWLCEELFNRLLHDTVGDLAWIVKAQQHEISNVPLEIMTWTKLAQVLSQGGAEVQHVFENTLEKWMNRTDEYLQNDLASRLSPGSFLFGLRTAAAGLQCLFAFSNATRCVASYRVGGQLPHRKNAEQQNNNRAPLHNDY